MEGHEHSVLLADQQFGGEDKHGDDDDGIDAAPDTRLRKPGAKPAIIA
jgi:hypothetical protein